MKKEKIALEQLIAGSLLIFDKVKNKDIEILKKDFMKKNPDCIVNDDTNLKQIKELVEKNSNEFTLKNNFNFNTSINEILKKIAGKKVSKYFTYFNYEEYILRKLDKLYLQKVDTLHYHFNKTQLSILEKLYENKDVYTFYNNEYIWDCSKVIALSKSGKLKLFKIDYKKEIEKFKEILKSLRYDLKLLDDYLLKQDLDEPVWSILDLTKLNDYCNEYDRAITLDNVNSVLFKRLSCNKETIIDKKDINKIEAMLSVLNNNCIYICHPNHIFSEPKLITKDVKEIKNVNWNDIDTEKMFRINDYKSFITPNCKEAFKYIHKRLGHQIMQDINNKDVSSYLAVVEQYIYDFEKYYIVRGIIKGDIEGYSIAFNPEYEKEIALSIWEKSLRISDNIVPPIYKVRRKK